MAVPADDLPLRNRGADAPGHFEDVTRAAGVSQHPTGNPLAGRTRWDDLYPELVIAGDHNTSLEPGLDGRDGGAGRHRATAHGVRTTTVSS